MISRPLPYERAPACRCPVSSPPSSPSFLVHLETPIGVFVTNAWSGAEALDSVHSVAETLMRDVMESPAVCLRALPPHLRHLWYNVRLIARTSDICRGRLRRFHHRRRTCFFHVVRDVLNVGPGLHSAFGLRLETDHDSSAPALTPGPLLLSWALSNADACTLCPRAFGFPQRRRAAGARTWENSGPLDARRTPRCDARPPPRRRREACCPWSGYLHHR